MKTLYLSIITISCFLCLCLLVLSTQFQTASALLCPPPPKTPVTCSPSDGSCFTPDMAISPITSNKCIGLFTKFTSSENSTAKDLYLRFFNADTNQTTNNVSFFINVTKQDKILGHDLFYAHSGIFAIKFQPIVQIGEWIVEGDQDPVLGGFTSPNDTIIIHSSTFTKEGLYHIHTEVLATDHAIINQTNTPKFDSWWSVDNKGNISKYDNSTISFGSTTHSVKIKDESPLKQFKSGIALKDIKCAPNLQLVIKAKTRSPACVKPDNVSKLVERGWADKPNSLQEQLDMANSCTGMTDACRYRYDTKDNDPSGITALIIYHPPDLCLNSPSHSIPSSMPSCLPNKFYLKINSNSTAYLMGYNICDGKSCATNNLLSLILPLNTGINPNYQMIGLPVNLQWKYGDTVGIQLYVSPTSDNKTASLVDLGFSTIVP